MDRPYSLEVRLPPMAGILLKLAPPASERGEGPATDPAERV